MKQIDTSITVAVRVRPLTENERTRSIASVVDQATSNPKVVIVGERGFSFDHVFIKEGQETVFDLLMTPVIEKLLEGVNCSVIAYGQTGTGKTYTMGTEPQDFGDTHNSGLISRTAEKLFESCCISDNALTISVSFVEIYNEEVFELLTEQPVRLDVKGFQIRGLTSKSVKTMDDVCSLLRQGTNNRHTRPTLLNSSSSRSHAIFTFRLCRRTGNDVLLSELHMVDLAGSERSKRTRTHGDAFQEAVCINRGLLELGNVIQSLSSGRHGNHVPYRNSLLTSVLHGSLQVHNMIAMIACVSPSVLDMAETLNTLRFVEKSKKIMHNIEINKVVNLHKNKLVSISSTVRPKYPLAVHNYQNSSVAGNERNRLCVTDTSEGSISSKMVDSGEFISPIVKRCCDQIEGNLNEKIEQIVMTTIQKEKRARRYFADSVSTMVYSPQHIDSRELLSPSNNKKTMFRKEIEKFQEQIRETMKSEMRNIIQEEIKVALTNTICSTVRALHNKTSSHVRGAPLLCRRLDFEHNTSPAVSQEEIKLQPRRSLRLFRSEKQVISSCKENIPVNVDFRENGEQILASTPLSTSFIFLAKEKRKDELGTPLKGSVLSPNRYNCISDSLGNRDKSDSPANCSREETSIVEAKKTSLRRSTHLSVKCLYNVQESATAEYSQTNTVLSTSNGNLLIQHKNLQVQNTPVSRRTNPDQVYLGNCDPGSTSRSNKIIYQNPKVVLKNGNKGRIRKMKHNKNSLRRQSVKTPKKVDMMKNLVALDADNYVHQEHINRVMSILNTGCTRELEKLPTIGPKTAFIINNYRILSGKTFTSVEDLKKIPGLNKNFYEKFCLANLVI